MWATCWPDLRTRRTTLPTITAGRPAPPSGNRATAEYLTDMIAQLESMARTGGLDLVAYLLAMARVEAGSNARAPGPGAAPRLSGR